MSSSMAEVVAAVQAAIDACKRRRTELVQAIGQCDRARNMLNAATDDTKHPAPKDARWSIEGCIKELREAIASLTAAEDKLSTYLARLESGSVTSGEISPIRTDTSAPLATGAAFDSRPYLDDMPVMPPKSQRKRGMPQQPTHGRWVAGKEEESELVSGTDADSQAVDELWSQIRRDGEIPSLMIASHIEPKFAMKMRRDTLTNERIVINNPDGPCGYGLDIQYGCDQLLPRLLPLDSTLTVCWPDGNEKTYRGHKS